MGPLGWQETVFIFFLALLLFGPKKLPELGRTIGKAMTEFRRASSELKATFDREMKTLEQETEFKELKEVTNQYQYDTYNYDYSSYEGSYNYERAPYGSEHSDSTDSTPSIASASAPQGAESPSVVAPNGDRPPFPNQRACSRRNRRTRRLWDASRAEWPRRTRSRAG